MQDYQHFLESKAKSHVLSGFDVSLSDLNQSLFPFQKFCVQRALRAGKYAFFQDCGLGKTIQQLEWAHHVSLKTMKPVLILCPLAVAGQTIMEGEKFHIPVYKWYEKQSYAIENGNNIWISNYEQLDNIDCSVFGGIVLDESSILKNFEGATKK